VQAADHRGLPLSAALLAAALASILFVVATELHDIATVLVPR
jgi:hypothetical protein